MKQIYFFIGLFFWLQNLVAQKSVIDKDAIDTWYSPNNVHITKNGLFAYYSASVYQQGKLSVVAIDSSFRIDFYRVNTDKVYIVGDDSILVFQIGLDSIAFYDLYRKNVEFHANCKDLAQPQNGSQNWLAWREYTDRKSQFILYNSRERKEISTLNVSSFTFSDNGDALLMKCEKSGYSKLKWIDLRHKELNEYTIYSGSADLSAFTFDKSAINVAFFKEDTLNNESKTSICLSNTSGVFATINSSTNGFDSRFLFSKYSLFEFSEDGRRLMFTVGAKKEQPGQKKTTTTELWRYNDSKVYPQQEKINRLPSLAKGFYNLSIDKIFIFRLSEDESAPYFDLNAKYQLFYESVQQPNSDQFQSGSGRKNLWLFDMTTGERKLLLSNRLLSAFTLSPDARHIVFGDREFGKMYTYTVQTGVIRSIRNTLLLLRYNKELMPPTYKLKEIPNYGQVIGWIKGGNKILLSDGYDIWSIDYLHGSKPINITSLGARKKIAFTRIKLPGMGNSTNIITPGDTLFLQGVDKDYKKGLFYLIVGISKEVNPIFFKPCNYTIVRDHDRILIDFETPYDHNWWTTVDFKAYKRVTDEYPQNKYNWFTKQLISWTGANGRKYRGIIYKPENFTASTKYPLLIRLYSNMTSHIYDMGEPALSMGDINSVWFASKGYIVLEPDIPISQPGMVGITALQCVESAVRHLIKNKWIDKTKVGLSGSSFGGYEVNYIISNSSLFAAAAPACAPVNLISAYGELKGWPTGSNGTMHYNFEYGQMRIGKNLWEKPGLYISNSPIFKAHKVKVPILIMHNRQDSNVPWQQGVEWFLAMRRLGKKAWLVQYDGEGHALFDREHQIDYTEKLTQFFDHYLMGKETPSWMSN